MSVTLHVNRDTNVTTLTASGRVSASDLFAELQKFYAGTPTELALCDLSQADLGLLSRQEVENLVKQTATWAHIRRGGRTAIVATTDFVYGMSRMYEIFAEVNRHPAAIRVFRTQDEALQWLQENNQLGNVKPGN